MIETVFPPGLILFIGAFLLPVLSGHIRSVVALALPLIALFLVWSVPDGAALTIHWFGYELVPVQGDALARLFGTVFTLMAFAGGLFALHRDNRFELAAAYAYAGASVGVVFAGDLLTVFVFWELMALASTFVIWCAGPSAWGASLRYAIIHLIGGVVLMAGIAAHVVATGSIAFTAMELGTIGTWLILIGFLINVGAPPVSAWVPDAYPSASWSGAVFLSAFTTKTAVLVLMRGFPGTEMLIWVGLYMIFYGIIYAILENDMRRILCYSIVNQVGFMVVGVGIGTEMAMNGVAAHAFAHIVYKALLLMSAGSVLYATGKSKTTELGGLFRSMPVTTICGIVGALSISAFPLTSGFVAKSMILQGAIDAHMALVFFGLTTASACAFLYVGLNFPWFTFFDRDSGLRPKDPPANMTIAMWLLVALCIGIGVAPGLFYELMPYPVDYKPYTTAHVVLQLQLLLFSGLVFFLLLKQLRHTPTITLDFDWFWRGLGRALGREFDGLSVTAWERLTGQMLEAARRFVAGIYRHHGPQGILARGWPTGLMTLWATLLLAAWLIAYYV